MLDTVTKDTFQSLERRRFQLALDDREPLPLELTAVLGTGLKGAASREQFSLHFRGPRAPALPQRTYHLEHAQLGGLDIFLVPIARDATGTTYEAVFT